MNLARRTLKKVRILALGRPHVQLQPIARARFGRHMEEERLGVCGVGVAELVEEVFRWHREGGGVFGVEVRELGGRVEFVPRVGWGTRGCATSPRADVVSQLVVQSDEKCTGTSIGVPG